MEEDKRPRSTRRRDDLQGLLTVIEAGSAAFSLCEVRKGVHLVGAPFDGVGAYLVLAGTLHMRGADGAVRVAQADSLLLLPAGHPPSMSAEAAPPRRTVNGAHAIRMRGGIPVIDACDGGASDLTVAAARIIGSSRQDMAEPRVVALDGPAAQQLLALLRAEFARDAVSGALAASLLSACVALALRGAVEASDSVRRSDHHEASIARSVTAVVAQPAAAHSIASLAGVAGMSRSTFLRQFPRIMACSPMEFLLRTRLKEAAAMLRSSDLTVQAIAKRTGFASRSHFSRAFSAAFGADPSAYRQAETADTGG